MAVDRAGRPTAVQAADWNPTASFLLAYKLGVLWTVFNKIFKEKIFILLKYFSAKVFGFKILILYLFLKC